MKPLLHVFNLPYFGEVPIYPFWLTILLGAFAACVWLYYLCKWSGLDPVVAIDIGIIAIFFSVLGSRVFHVLFEYPWYYWEDPMRVFDFMAGGFVSLGAYTFSFIAGMIYFRRRKIAALPYMDQVALTLPLVIFFVRMGCLLEGCCYGRPTDFFFHLIFPQGSTAHYFMGSAPLHAYQLYAMINACIMFIVLWCVRRRQRFVGQVWATFFVYLGATRFWLEYLRGDADRGVYLEWLLPRGISTGQIVMLISLALGLHMYRRGLASTKQ